MSKLFGFIGSPLKQKSNTYTLTKMMLDFLVKKDNNITYELITAGDVKINYCKGCRFCLGSCPDICVQDKNDDMAMLKNKMIEADILIFASPVYTLQVSGQMKTFLDRLCGWFHILRLTGKGGIAVSTAGGMGIEEVNKFLSNMMTGLGVKYIAQIGAYANGPLQFRDYDNMTKEAQKIAENLYPYLTGKKLIESDENLEFSFSYWKRYAKMVEHSTGGFTDYWKKHNMLELNSFDELLEKKKSGA